MKKAGRSKYTDVVEREKAVEDVVRMELEK